METFRACLTTWSTRDRALKRIALGGCPLACVRGSDAWYVTQAGAAMSTWRARRPSVPAVQRVSSDGRVSVVAERAGGHRFVAPNDLAFGAERELYVTDPGRAIGDGSPGRLFVLWPDGTGDVLLELGPAFPNGVEVDADGCVVWVESATRRVARRRRDGRIETIAVLPEGHSPDGFTIAADGRLFVATVQSGGIDVLSASGAPEGFLPTGGHPLNCALGPDGNLYVTDYGPALDERTDAQGARTGRLLRIAVDAQPASRRQGRIAVAA